MLNALEGQRNEMEKVIDASGAGAEDIPATPVLQKQVSKRGRKPTDLPTPKPDSSSDDILNMLSSYSESELQQKLKGNKVNKYMKLLALRTHMKGSTNPISAQEKREAIIGLVHNYKRDSRLNK